MRKLMEALVLGLGLVVSALAQGQQAAWTREQFVEQLESKNFQQLDAQLAAFQEPALSDLSVHRAYFRAMDALTRRRPVNATQYDEWVAATGSGTAYLVRGEFHLERAWLARGSAYAYQTHSDAFIRMKQQLVLAREDFQKAQDKLGPRCDWCVASLISVDILSGQRSRAVATLDVKLRQLSGGIMAPQTYLHYLQPKWGGSWQEMERFIDGFTKDFPAHPVIKTLQSDYVYAKAVALHQAQRHQEARGQYELAAQMNPDHAGAWAGMASMALAADRDELVLMATDKALALTPSNENALTARAHVLLKGKTPLDAVPLLERAVGVGSDWALEALLPIVASGRYGYKPDRERAERICQDAIDAFRPAGFACMGGLYYFGIGRAVDKPKALEWFMAASDRGFVRATMDAALMLSRGDGVPRDMDRAVSLWLKAREAGEPSADGLLRQNLSTWQYFSNITWPAWKAGLAGILNRFLER